MLVPHEFQWHGQVAIAVLASIGLVHAARYAGRRFVPTRHEAVGAAAVGTIMLIGVLAPAVPFFEYGGAYFGDLEGIVRTRSETISWIEHATGIEAVFACEPGEAYMTVAGLTGRKCAALPAGHTNPAVDAGKRLAAVEDLFSSRREAGFQALAAALEVDFVLLRIDSEQAVAQVQAYRSWSSLREVFASAKERTVVFSTDPS
jgi:hypothetical protein